MVGQMPNSMGQVAEVVAIVLPEFKWCFVFNVPSRLCEHLVLLAYNAGHTPLDVCPATSRHGATPSGTLRLNTS